MGGLARGAGHRSRGGLGTCRAWGVRDADGTVILRLRAAQARPSLRARAARTVQSPPTIMRPEVRTSGLSIQVPRDFIALSRRILHFANLGTPRFEFLQEVSRLLLEFTGCDGLHIRLRGPRISYRWRAGLKPDEHFGYESEDDPRYSAIDRLAEAVARGEIKPSAPCLTRHGSFWTGNLAEALAGLGEHGSLASQNVQGFRSILLVHFEIQQNDRGYLLLASAQADFFSPESTELYEAVTQTLALAIADRRAQASLRERVKELTCLYRISQIKADTDLSFPMRLQLMAECLPIAWQYPENAVALIELDGRVFSTGAATSAHYRQLGPIRVGGITRGHVQVAYVGNRPEFSEGPFLPEEQSLIEAVAREISLFVERDELHRCREQLQDQLRHADRLALIGKLAAGVAHEINEPLGGILGFSQLLKNSGGLGDGQTKDLDKIIAAALHAREIVRKLVLFARQEPLKRTPVNVNRVVEESLSMLEARCAQAGIAVVKRLAADLPEISADPVQLRQVVLNLTVNAIQAMPNGGTLTLSSFSRHGAVCFAVEDTGVGMTEEVLRDIFTPFYTTKDVGEGTGLGLAVAHGIVNAHGGVIDARSRPGHGARFEVRFINAA